LRRSTASLMALFNKPVGIFCFIWRGLRTPASRRLSEIEAGFRGGENEPARIERTILLHPIRTRRGWSFFSSFARHGCRCCAWRRSHFSTHHPQTTPPRPKKTPPPPQKRKREERTRPPPKPPPRGFAPVLPPNPICGSHLRCTPARLYDSMATFFVLLVMPASGLPGHPPHGNVRARNDGSRPGCA